MFSALGLNPALSAPLARLGYKAPTPIQNQAIPLVLTGVDVLARAQTGTGKTAAFGLPMLERFLARTPATNRQKPRGLVLVPTRELAAQVHRALTAYGAPAQVRVVAIFGGVAMGGQVHALRRGTDIIVATPGRLLDHMERRTVDLSAIEVLTLDEADRMLDMGFLPALRRVVKALPTHRQTLLFSATLSDEVVSLSSAFTRNAVRIDASEGQVVAVTVKHQVHHVAADRKRDVLAGILTDGGQPQALVFCRTKRGANRVGEDLGQRGVATGIIHGNKSQSARSRALDDFKAGRVRVLVATDIAARGLDIVQLPLVVNFDLPLVAEDYVHRVGRTGRAGHHGRAVSLVTAAEASLLRDIQKVVTEPLEHVGTPGPETAASRHGSQPRTASAPGRTHEPHEPRGHAPRARHPRRGQAAPGGASRHHGPRRRFRARG